MKNKLALFGALAGAAALGALAVSYGAAQTSTAPENKALTSSNDVITSFSDIQEDEIRQLVRAYILDNPEIIFEAADLHRQKQQLLAMEQAISGARTNLDLLTDPTNGFVAGLDVDNANVVVIELMDYHCGFCKQASGLVQAIANQDKDIKVVFRELPILREESDIAAEYALAARDQDKYIDFHFAMMNASGVLTEGRIKDIAQENGLDVKALDKARKNPKVAAAIMETHEIAQDMNVDGTPAFIVASTNGEFLDAIIGWRPEEISAAIVEAKKAAK